jgi:putative phosphoesterase
MAAQVKLAITSDTHLPRGQRQLPAPVVAQLKAADLIVHAGDFSRLVVLRELEAYGEVIAVQGNVDDAQLRRLLPQTLELELPGGARLAVIHDAGPASGRFDRLRRRFPEAAAVVFGHSHTPLHQIGPDGFQIFNPGSPTDRRRSPHPTMGLAVASTQGLRIETIVVD